MPSFKSYKNAIYHRTRVIISFCFPKYGTISDNINQKINSNSAQYTR